MRRSLEKELRQINRRLARFGIIEELPHGWTRIGELYIDAEGNYYNEIETEEQIKNLKTDSIFIPGITGNILDMLEAEGVAKFSGSSKTNRKKVHDRLKTDRIFIPEITSNILDMLEPEEVGKFSGSSRTNKKKVCDKLFRQAQPDDIYDEEDEIDALDDVINVFNLGIIKCKNIYVKNNEVLTKDDFNVILNDTLIEQMIDRPDDLVTLVYAGADPQIGLWAACEQGLTDIASMMIDYGADVNEINENDSQNALSLTSNAETMRMLINRGANVQEALDILIMFSGEENLSDTGLMLKEYLF